MSLREEALKLLNKYFLLHIPHGELEETELETSFKQNGGNSQSFKEYITLAESIIQIASQMGDWNLNAISTKAQDYSNLKEFQRILQQQFTMFSYLKEWLKHIGFSDEKLKNKSYGTIKETFLKLTSIVNRCYGVDLNATSLQSFQQFLVSQDKPPVGLTIGPSLWKKISGPITVRVIAPSKTILSQQPNLPVFLLLGDLHGGYGDCDTPSVNVLDKTFFQTLNVVASTETPVDFYVEDFLNKDLETMMIDFNLTGGKRAAEIFKVAKTKHDNTLLDLTNQNQSCFLRNQRRNPLLRAEGQHCDYDNVRFQYADPRHMNSIDNALEFCMHHFMEYFLYHQDLKVLVSQFKKVSTTFLETFTASEFQQFFDAFATLVLTPFQSHGGPHSGVDTFVTMFFTNPLFKGKSVLRKYQERNLTIFGKTVEQVYREMLSIYHAVDKMQIDYTPEKANIAKQLLENLFLLIKKKVFAGSSLKETAIERAIFDNEDIAQFIENMLLFVETPIMDTYFLFRCFKLMQSRPLDYETKPHIPWMEVLYAGDAHCYGIGTFLRSQTKYYTHYIEFTVESNKERCVDITAAINMNKLHATIETARGML